MVVGERSLVHPLRGRRRDDVRELEILEGALEMLREVGYDRMTLDGLATRVRASKATLYRRWSGKADLVCEAVRRCKTADMTDVDTGSLRDDLLTLARSLVDHLEGEDGAQMVGVLVAMRRDPELAAAMQEQMRARADLPGVLVARAVARGELSAGADAQLVHDLLPGALFVRLLVTGDPVDEPFLTHLVDDVLVPLLSRPTRTQPLEATP